MNPMRLFGAEISIYWHLHWEQPLQHTISMKMMIWHYKRRNYENSNKRQEQKNRATDEELGQKCTINKQRSNAVPSEEEIAADDESIAH